MVLLWEQQQSDTVKDRQLTVIKSNFIVRS